MAGSRSGRRNGIFLLFGLSGSPEGLFFLFWVRRDGKVMGSERNFALRTHVFDPMVSF